MAANVFLATFPDLVFGSFFTMTTFFMAATGPILLRTNAITSCLTVLTSPLNAEIHKNAQARLNQMWKAEMNPSDLLERD